jgi:hypothetical protein
MNKVSRLKFINRRDRLWTFARGFGRRSGWSSAGRPNR